MAEADHEAWFTQAWREYRDPLVRYLRRHIHDPGQAEDLVQGAFRAAWCARDQRPAEIGPWLYRVARNHSVDQFRSESRRRDVSQHLPAEPSNDGGIGYSIFHVAIEQACKRLTSKERECLMLSVFDELSDGDIAVVVQTSPQNVRQRRHRALKKLRKALGEPNTSPGLSTVPRQQGVKHAHDV